MNTKDARSEDSVDEAVRTLPSPSYSTGEGPECPFCGRQYVADEPEYMDESGFETECDECGNSIRIEPHISVAWTTRAISFANTHVVNS